jgi:hypothetical protein
MAAASIFQSSDFDLNPDSDVYSQELSYLQHKLEISAVGRVITIKGDENRHYTLDHVDRVNGDIMGWWYFEIGGTGRVLIVND